MIVSQISKTFCERNQKKAMKILWLDRLISTLNTQSWGTGKRSHPAGSHPFPAGPKRWLPPLYSLLWSQGLTQGHNHHTLKFCTWKVMYCIIVKAMISTRRLPPNIETCRIWFTLIARLWRWQPMVASLADRPMEPCSAPAISHGATRGQCVAAYGKHCKEIQLVNPKGNHLFFWSWAGGVACIFLRLILCLLLRLLLFSPNLRAVFSPCL